MVLFFPELVLKWFPERANGGQAVEIRVYVFLGIWVWGQIPVRDITIRFRSSLRPQSGHDITPDPPILPIRALYRLRSGYCKALFDQKLLDYLA